MNLGNPKADDSEQNECVIIMPLSKLITEAWKIADMIRISCAGLCGEDDFRFR